MKETMCVVSVLIRGSGEKEKVRRGCNIQRKQCIETKSRELKQAENAHYFYYYLVDEEENRASRKRQGIK